MVSPLTAGGSMRIGDLVHNPRYPYWGIGIIVDREEEADGMILAYWVCEEDLVDDWVDKEDLEIL